QVQCAICIDSKIGLRIPSRPVMRWLRSRVHDCIDLAATAFEQLCECGTIPNIEVMMLITADACDQIIPRSLDGSFSAKESRPHIVIDPDDARALFCASSDGFRADQSRRACDDDCAHLAYSTRIRAIVQDDCQLC